MSLADVLDDYTNLLASIAASIYKSTESRARQLYSLATDLYTQFISDVHSARDTLKPSLAASIRQSLDAIVDLSPVQPKRHGFGFLFSNYVATAMVLFSLSFGQKLGARPWIGAFLSLFFDTWVVLLLSCFLLPFHYYLLNMRRANEANAQYLRYGLMLLAIGMGCLSAHTVSDMHMVVPTYSPPTFFMPIAIATTTYMFGSCISVDRRVFLGMTAGSGALFYLVLGALFGAINYSYVCSVVTATGAAIVSLQLLIADLQSEQPRANMVNAQLYTLASSTCQFVTFTYVFGVHNN